MLRRWEGITGWLSIINWVDNTKLASVESLKADVSSVNPSSLFWIKWSIFVINNTLLWYSKGIPPLFKRAATLKLSHNVQLIFGFFGPSKGCDFANKKQSMALFLESYQPSWKSSFWRTYYQFNIKEIERNNE